MSDECCGYGGTGCENDNPPIETKVSMDADHASAPVNQPKTSLQQHGLSRLGSDNNTFLTNLNDHFSPPSLDTAGNQHQYPPCNLKPIIIRRPLPFSSLLFPSPLFLVVLSLSLDPRTSKGSLLSRCTANNPSLSPLTIHSPSHDDAAAPTVATGAVVRV